MPIPPETPTTCRRPFGLASLLTTAVFIIGGVISPRATAADFSTSFEVREPVKPLENTVEKISRSESFQKNVRGVASNALMESIEGIMAITENGPGETANRAADDETRSKWLAFQSSGWLKYKLTKGGASASYSLTSGDDHPELDPRDWKLLGSDDGEKWTTLDAQKNQSWGDRERGVTKSFPAGSSRAFSHARETAQPDYYAVDRDNGIKAEMTPTNRGLVMQFSFRENAGSVVLDSPTGDGDFSIDLAIGAVTGWIDHGAGFVAGQSRMFVSGKFDQVPATIGQAAGGSPVERAIGNRVAGERRFTLGKGHSNFRKGGNFTYKL